ncbi:globin family protein [Deinococcus hopiensis]|uniref:Hemoglobin-like flavoprotein n=1 Tax=Deinococcus hopiensis KR-140 TaxID=695939 RepID=A0A1W1UB80_9DEIO|nr:globin family protein [Deinococcus hopiensis]SMB78319.1 Hemoglobin-like flavoprotein [Deinococcus hopiensis KR-140]
MTLTPEDVRLVQTTFQQVRPHAEAAAGLFYDRLFALDPSLRPMFRGDMRTQGRHLMAALAFVTEGLSRPETILPAVRDLGRRHAGYGVQDGHYATVGGALLDTLAAFFGDAFTPEVREAWIRAYALLADEMMEAARAPAPVGGLR